MNSKVVISICCITFNHADYIEKCIEGFLAQKFPHKMEIIIGDDLSSDGTREKLQKIQLQHPDLIKVIYNQENMGANKNILSVLRQAKGEFIAFCEGDDYWIHEDKLYLQYKLLKTNPSVDFCFHSAYMDSEGEKKLHFKYGERTKKFYINDVLKVAGQFAPTSSYMFRRNIIYALPAWFPQSCIGDLFMEIYSMKKGGIYIPLPMSVYRVNSVGSWSETIKSNLNVFTEKHLNIATHLRLAKQEFNGYEKYFNLKIANVYLNMCTRFIIEKEYKLFKVYLEKANSINEHFTRKQLLYNGLRFFPT
ncbi:TPA: glycosyltransferase family 2 protein, partial [Escherichia coli]